MTSAAHAAQVAAVRASLLLAPIKSDRADEARTRGKA